MKIQQLLLIMALFFVSTAGAATLQVDANGTITGPMAAKFWAANSNLMNATIGPIAGGEVASAVAEAAHATNADNVLGYAFATNSALMYSSVTNALPGSLVLLAPGIYDITNYPLMMNRGVTLRGSGTNATILRNWVTTETYTENHGAGIGLANDCVVEYLQITNAVGTNYQTCIGTLTPQLPHTNAITRGLLCYGDSDGFSVSMPTGSCGLWTDFGSEIYGNWDTHVYVYGDFSTPTLAAFHGYGTKFHSRGPSRTSPSNIAHGFYAQADYADIILDHVTFDVSGSAQNRAWELEPGLIEGDILGPVTFNACIIVNGTEVNGAVKPITIGNENGIGITNIQHSATATLATNFVGQFTGSVFTNAGFAWLGTNLATGVAPTADLPNGSILTTTGGLFYVRSNSIWVQK